MSLFRVANASFPLMPVQLCVRGSAVSMRLSGEVLSVRNVCGKQTKLASTHCANCRLRALSLSLSLPSHCPALDPVPPHGSRRHPAEAPPWENSVNDADLSAHA